MNTLRSRRSVAIVRELWYARDDIARDRDTSIGRVLPDAALVEIAKAVPATPRRPAPRAPGHRPLRTPVGRGGAPGAGDPRGRPAAAHAALRRPSAAAGLGREEPRWPPTGSAPPGPRSPRSPQEHVIPVENVCSPDPLRRVVWQPPDRPRRGGVHPGAARPGLRPWQAEIVAPMLVAAFDQFPDA